MHRSRAPSIAPGTFFVAQPWADCITNMPGFNLRQAQPEVRPAFLGLQCGMSIGQARRALNEARGSLGVVRETLAEPVDDLAAALADR